MWWEAVFWILLLPLIVIEIVIFVKSRKFFWLVYALSIFTYIVAVSYTIDVFSLGRNAVLLILLASAALMFLIGRQLGKKVKTQKTVSTKERNVVIVIAALMIILFVVSVIFGKASETVTPVTKINANDIVVRNGKEIPYPQNSVTVLQRTVSNKFILPVPLVQEQYRVCAQFANGVQDVGINYDYQQYPEVAPGQTKTVDVKISAVYIGENQQTPSAILIYAPSDNYAPCSTITDAPLYKIPVQ